MSSESKKETLDDGTIHWRLPCGLSHRVDGPAIVYPSGEKRWLQNGQLHREDGPAIEGVGPGGEFMGLEQWALNGKTHRVGGPAATYECGTEYWMQEGELHRIDGAALISSDGSKEWYLFGKRYSHDDAPKTFIAASEMLVALFPETE